MNVSVFATYEDLSAFAAQELLKTIKSKPQSALCLATGESPKLTYELFVQESIRQEINFDRVHFIALDEWMGIPPTNPGSCAFFLEKNLFSPLRINSSNIHLFDPFSQDTVKECEKMNVAIQMLGGIDLMLVGVGMNGHIGFNEPGASEQLYAHVTNLDSITQQVGQKYFAKKTVLTKGITLGLAHFFEAQKVLMLANGKKKSSIIKKAIEGPVTTEVPASLIRKHKNSLVLIDQEAASELPGQ